MRKLNEYIIRNWLLSRMAAQEFYFKSPFEIKEEYTIMKSILCLALVPLELLFVFAYARIFGSLGNYTWQIIIIVVLINILISNLIINKAKNNPIIGDTVSYYHQSDYSERKKLYSFRNIAYIVFLTALLPWLIMFLGILVICLIFPR